MLFGAEVSIVRAGNGLLARKGHEFRGIEKEASPDQPQRENGTDTW